MTTVTNQHPWRGRRFCDLVLVARASRDRFRAGCLNCGEITLVEPIRHARRRHGCSACFETREKRPRDVATTVKCLQIDLWPHFRVAKADERFRSRTHVFLWDKVSNPTRILACGLKFRDIVEGRPIEHRDTLCPVCLQAAERLTRMEIFTKLAADGRIPVGGWRSIARITTGLNTEELAAWSAAQPGPLVWNFGGAA